MKCRHCENTLNIEFVDLDSSPPSNSFLTESQLNEKESYYPLSLQVCEKCFLVQIDEHKSAEEIFSNDYVYFSSFSKSWLQHSEKYANMIIDRLRLDSKSLVVEVASNDGYLLQYFHKQDIPTLGIEPTENTADVAIEKGIESIKEFFGENLARKLVEKGKAADLLIGNNVLAHVPDINDFVLGLKILLKAEGVINMEFPHLMQLVENNQFDTIYHEHFSYLSLTTVSTIFQHCGLEVFDVDEIPTHGGSLRIYAKHKDDTTKSATSKYVDLMEKERLSGIKEISYYEGFQSKVTKIKDDLLSFLKEAKEEGKKVAGYGAAAKGNTLINYCNISSDLIQYVVDASPYKQGKYLPGSHIPVVKEDVFKETKPDYIIILPWNIKEEIVEQIAYVREWGCKFVIAIPKLQIL